MKTLLELFLVTRIPEGFHVVRKALDLSQEQRDPDSVANEYVQFMFQDSSLITDKERYILHSTSWRYEAPHTIVLTYLVYADSFSFQHLHPYLLRTRELKLAHSENPKVPRPNNLSQNAILSHGLRHVAYLFSVDTRGVFKKVVSKETQQLFRRIDTQLAGELF